MINWAKRNVYLFVMLKYQEYYFHCIKKITCLKRHLSKCLRIRYKS